METAYEWCVHHSVLDLACFLVCYAKPQVEVSFGDFILTETKNGPHLFLQ